MMFSCCCWHKLHIEQRVFNHRHWILDSLYTKKKQRCNDESKRKSQREKERVRKWNCTIFYVKEWFERRSEAIVFRERRAVKSFVMARRMAGVWQANDKINGCSSMWVHFERKLLKCTSKCETWFNKHTADFFSSSRRTFMASFLCRCFTPWYVRSLYHSIVCHLSCACHELEEILKKKEL